MNSDDPSKNQLQSLVSHSLTPTEPSGAGSTIANTQLSQDSTTTHTTDTPLHSTFDGSEVGTQTSPDSATVKKGENVSKAVAIGDKGHESDVQDDESHVESIKEEPEGTLSSGNQQIELLEHIPDTVVDEGQDWAQDTDHEMKRVKVYELIGARWIDQGTAFCFGQFQEDTGEALLIARSEKSYNDIILSTAIRSNDVYQRQQDTLIVWTEPDGVDYALSFQDPEGCSEVWNFILEVQRHMNSGEDQSTVASSPQPGAESTSVTTAGIIRSGHLPQPQLGIIGEIERAIKTLARTQSVKERICEYIKQEGYIKLLIEVMNTAEDLESLENLHALCSMMTTILMLNNHAMYEHILEDDIFFGVVGMLEYDPDFPAHKANYREFLHQTSHFHQPIPIRDSSIQRKIHHTYRLQFLKDVVLARALDDSTFNVLNSCIIFNQIDIITHIQQDPTFLREIVKLFVDEEVLGNNSDSGPTGKKNPSPGQPPLRIGSGANGETMKSEDKCDLNAMQVDHKPLSSSNPSNGNVTPLLNGHTALHKPEFYAYAPPPNLSQDDLALRREVILLIQQLCIMGKNVQLATRMALFRSLVDRGILFAVQWALGLPEKEVLNQPMISAAGEILISLLDHDLNGVRGHVLKQVVAIEKERDAGKKGSNSAETILEMTCRIMAQSKDLAVQCHVGDALKIWMDVPSGDAGTSIATLGNTEASQALGSNKPPIRKDDPGTERYMDYFYKECVNLLFKPFFNLPEWRNVTETILTLSKEETNRYVYLCDLFYNFTAQHHFRSLFYLLSSNIAARLASLLKAKDKHLRHAAFRIFRLLLKQNNPNTHAQIMKHDIVKPILDLTLQESRRDNLLSCSCQEYFDTMRRENMKDLAKFCMSKHEDQIRILAKSPLGGQRFEQFIAWWQWEMLQQVKEPILDSSNSEKPRPSETRGWPQGRAMDAEEEDYFNADDDEEDDLTSTAGQPWARVSPGAIALVSPLNNNDTLKRKRRLGVGTSPKGYRPPLRTPVLSSLVDYGDDEDDDRPPPPSAKKSREAFQKERRSSSPDVPPASPKLSHRQVVSATGAPPKRDLDDDEVNVLETLSRSKSRPQSPAPGMMASSDTLRSSEKRRRTEDDEDEMMMRLSKAKKPDLGTDKERFGFGNLQVKKNGDDKKIKVKLGTTSLGLPPSTLSLSETGAKDGDTG